MVGPFMGTIERKIPGEARLIKIHKKMLAERVLRARVVFDHRNSLAKRHLWTKQQLRKTRTAGRTLL